MKKSPSTKKPLPDYGPVNPPMRVWLRIVNGHVVETFFSSQAANASEDQDHIHAYVLEE